MSGDNSKKNEGLTRRGAIVAGVAGVAAAAALPTARGGAVESKAAGERKSAPKGERMPVVYMPHGGGPWPFVEMGLPKADVDDLSAYLRDVRTLPKTQPRALLVISAHWEERVPTVMTAPRPPMFYDYYGFPPASYELKWPAPGDPQLAARVQQLLQAAGFPTASDDARGFDHGTFVPLKLTYPDADIPTVQLSLQAGLDPATHLKMGRALAPLRDEGVFIVGSGMTFHNMRAFMSRSGRDISESFDAWLRETAGQSPAERDRRLTEWTQAPAARQAHPREEHLLPLMVCAGAAGDDVGVTGYNNVFMGVRLSAYHFG